MKQKNELISIFSATFLGFIFALSLFIIQENIKESTAKKLLIRNVIHELQYDLLVLDKFERKFENLMLRIMNEDKTILLGFNYSDVKFFFLNKFYQSGDLINHVTIDELHSLHRLTAIYTNEWTKEIIKFVSKWNTSEETKERMLILLEYEKSSTLKSKKLFNLLINEFKKLT